MRSRVPPLTLAFLVASAAAGALRDTQSYEDGRQFNAYKRLPDRGSGRPHVDPVLQPARRALAGWSADSDSWRRVLTGRQGDYTLGLLNIQTERFDGRPAYTFTTLRAARNFGGSSVGGFYLGREASGAAGHNRVAGGDVHLNVRQTMDFYGFVMGSETTGRQSGGAGRAAFSVSERSYSADVSYTNFSPAFRNDLGFVSRGDIGLVAWDAARHFRSSRSDSLLRVVSCGSTTAPIPR